MKELRAETRKAANGLLEVAGLKPGQILVVGGSTSEVLGEPIGTAGNLEVAGEILGELMDIAEAHGLYLAVQCCEHLNRALVVESRAVQRYDLEEVTVRPHARAGGSLAATAMQRFSSPVVVESIRAHAGIDIGLTLIGMHLRRVAVPVRVKGAEHIGRARVVLARTRPPLIGGARALYP